MLADSNTKKQRTTIAVSSTIGDMISDEMIAENRTSMSNMAEVLLAEALNARQKLREKKSKKEIEI